MLSNPIPMGEVTKRIINKKDPININECLKAYERLTNSKGNNFKNAMDNLLEVSLKNNYSYYAVEALRDNRTTHSDIRKIGLSLLLKESDLDIVKKQIMSLDVSSERDFLLERVDIYSNCDRIYRNHNRIRKTFSMNFNRNITLEDRVFKICEMVDTYNLNPHIKVGICIDEVAYDAYLNDYAYNEQDSLDFITSYYLSIPNLTSEDINIKIPRAIKENNCISLNAADKIQYLFEGEKEEVIKVGGYNVVLESGESNKIKKLINNYKLEADKDDTKFKAVLKKIFTQDPDHIVEELPDILKFVRTFFIFGAFAVNPVAGAIVLVVNGYLHFNLRQEQLNGIISHFKAEISKMEDKMYETTDEKKEARIKEYIKELEDAVKKFEDKRKLVYSDKAQYELESSQVYNESENFDRQLKIFNNDLNKIKQLFKIHKNPHVINYECAESFDIDNYKNHLTREGRLQVNIASCLVSEDADLYNIGKSLQRNILSINSVLESTNNTGKLNFILTPETLDVFVESSMVILTDVNETDLSDEVILTSESDMKKLAILNYYLEHLERLNNDKIINIVENAVNNAYRLSLEEAKLFIEAASYSNIDKQEIEAFVYVYMEDNNLNTFDAYSLATLFETTQFHNTDIGLMTEALSIMAYILEEEDKEEDDEKEDSKEDNKEDSKSKDDSKKVSKASGLGDEVGSNDKVSKIKSLLNKAKSTLSKDAPGKVRELSRDLDNAVNSFSKAISLYEKGSSDKERENLVKGSLGMSLTKVIKIGTALIVAGVLMGSLVLPIVAVGVGLILTVKGTPEAKNALADKIDIELQIIGREIKELEDSPDKLTAKKYRKLLSYEKGLQRQKQKLVYRDPNKLKQANKRFISSTKGIGKGDND